MKIKIKITIFSNGTILDLQILGTLKSCSNIEIYFSLDGTEKITDSIRGKGVFKNVLENIRKCAEFGISVSISLCLSKYNYKNVEIFLNKMNNLNLQLLKNHNKGIKKIQIINLRNRNYNKEFSDNLLTYQELEQVFNKFIKKRLFLFIKSQVL
jgi:sulfatase maturation enzyme AslB (radical SAM superfamily)